MNVSFQIFSWLILAVLVALCWWGKRYLQRPVHEPQSNEGRQLLLDIATATDAGESLSDAGDQVARLLLNHFGGSGLYRLDIKIDLTRDEMWVHRPADSAIHLVHPCGVQQLYAHQALFMPTAEQTLPWWPNAVKQILLAVATDESGEGVMIEIYDPSLHLEDADLITSYAAQQLKKLLYYTNRDQHWQQTLDVRYSEEAERSIRALDIDSIKTPTLLIDATGRINRINFAAQVLLDKNSSEVIGSKLADFMAEKDHAGMVQTAIEQRNPMQHGLDLVFDGEVLGRFQLELIPLTAKMEGVSAYFLAFLRKEASLLSRMVTGTGDIHHTESRFRDVVEAMDDGVFISDPERSWLQPMGAQWLDIFGLTDEEVSKDPLSYLSRVLPQDRDLLTVQLEFEARMEPTDIVFRIDHPRYGLRWLRQRTRTRLYQDESPRVYGLVTDVTEERQREIDLRDARDAAEAANKAKSQFLANMSHEIRTPMNGILGMTELLLGTALNDKQRRFALAVFRSGEGLLEIINDILDFAKIEAGRLELAPTEMVLRSLVEDTLELLSPRAHEKGLEINYREELGLPQFVKADSLRMRQVLTNVVANAIKFTQKGEVTVDVSHDRGAIVPEGMMLRFSVKDTGIGIAPDVLPKLFHAFSQAHGGMSRRFGGTGLGLAISKQLVELMGGTIEAKSTPGVGSEFIFTVPVEHVTKDSGDMSFDDETMPHLRILVIDDNDTNRTVLENMLSAWGMKVELASDGLVAIERLKQEQSPLFDLALVDMHMPNMDGFEFAKVLKTDLPHLTLKLIMLSSISRPDDVHSAYSLGFYKFLPKPIRKAELRRTLLGLISGRAETIDFPKLNLDVLVVEDNAINQEVTTQMLRRLGCRSVVASSGMEGLQALCQQSFDIVLMDIQMPGMDGMEALRWFKRGSSERFQFKTKATTPVVAVTANALDGDEARFLAQGFNDYLSKPFRQGQLQMMLARCIPGQTIKSLDRVPDASVNHDALQDFGKQGTDEEFMPVLAPSQQEITTNSSSIPPTKAVEATVDQSASLAGPCILDKTAIDQLRALDPTGQHQVLKRVVNAFEISLEKLVPQLDEGLLSNDAAMIRHVAHTLKSSTASIGALKLSQICSDMENVARKGALQELGDMPNLMKHEAQLALASLKTLV